VISVNLVQFYSVEGWNVSREFYLTHSSNLVNRNPHTSDSMSLLEIRETISSHDVEVRIDILLGHGSYSYDPLLSPGSSRPCIFSLTCRYSNVYEAIDVQSGQIVAAKFTSLSPATHKVCHENEVRST
jgi:hypothetical protein